MLDPLSIAGLTITIFDQLLKLGERTAELITDIQAFDEDTDTLYNKLKDEINRTRQLRCLLFEASPIYGGRALFEKFDEDVQDQIKIFLGRLVSTLHEGYELLQRRYGTRSSSSLAPSPSPSMSNLSITTSNSSTQTLLKSFPKSPLLLLRWSLRDKKRTEEILQNFSDLNGRIHENIKLWSLASSIGVDIQHLEHLQTDISSIELGFNVDAALQLTASNAQAVPGTLELCDEKWSSALSESDTIEERFGLIYWKGNMLLQENHPYQGNHDISMDLDSRTRTRVDGLAKLLHQPKEHIFCIPRCVGWKHTPESKRIAFAFEIPAEFDPKPLSLLRLLDIPAIKPTLSEKFQLAFALARCIAQLQMVKWVHESFRSENILFFPQKTTESKDPCNLVPQLDYGRPWVLGFEFSRPEADFSLGVTDACIIRDIYRHPSRQGQPEKVFNKLHDIYALGVVLLELGLWEKAITLEKNRFSYAKGPHVIQAQLQKQASRRLGPKVGEKYKQVVLKCLSGDFGVTDDTKDDLKLQQAFRNQVVDVLERAAANV